MELLHDDRPCPLVAECDLEGSYIRTLWEERHLAGGGLAMADPRYLSNAPISEAILDFRVKARADIDGAELGEARSQLAPLYPIVEERTGFQFQVESGLGQSTFRETGIQGFFYATIDKLSIAQFRIDGFTFNRLRPYSRWEEIFPEAMRLWKVYCAVARPQTVVRLATRYLNRISLPATITDFERYLTAPAPVPKDLPQQVSSFLTRVTIHDPESGLAANIGQTLQADVDAKQVSLLLDIDAFREWQYDCGSSNVAETLEALRRFKNQIFFGLLTEEALRGLQ